jgi:nucleotide-binding universal stress UspA family protein
MTIVDECALVLSLGKCGAPPFARLPDGKEGITLQPAGRGASGRAHSGGRIVMYKRIVLAVDLAEQAPNPKGLEQALELAKMGGGLLRLVNVQPVVPATFMEYVPVDFDMEQAKRATDALDAILAAVDLPAERKSAAARAGGIYHELLQEAAEWGADLIVVGSHRPVMSDYLLGSNAKTIVRHAQCSVLVVRE